MKNILQKPTANGSKTAGLVIEPRRRVGYRRLIAPLIAILLVLAVWEGVYLLGWRPHYVFPSPLQVAERLMTLLGDAKFWSGLSTTLVRAGVGFGVAVLVGTASGLLVSQSPTFRAAVGSLITGMQTMPSIAWFPFAILIFGLSENAILFVVLLGAAPSIANGLISGVDEIPRPLLRNAQSMGATGLRLYRYVVMPAALPAYLSGLKQGWAFAWRSLMAGELLVIIASRPSLGASLQFFREFSDASGLMAVMIVILLLGMGVDRIFAVLTTQVQLHRGLGGGGQRKRA